MFKRAEKHRQKKEDAKKLSLDDRWQEILGFHDTDLDESASESDDTTDGIDEQTNATGDYSEDEEDEDEMTVGQALIDPLYLASSIQPDVKACIICPGKVLKGSKMEELHFASNASMIFLVNLD